MYDCICSSSSSVHYISRLPLDVVRLMKSTAHMVSPYGILRSPWNYNPSPYLARYGNVFQITDTALLGESGGAVFRPHMGVHCTDYDSFFVKNKGKSFETYLSAIENQTHGAFHYTFGGVGGKISQAAIKVLTDKYGFTDSNIATLATSAQPFFKKSLTLSHTHPVNCTVSPWQDGVRLLRATARADPGSNPGPTCDFSDYFYESEDSLNILISSFFKVDNDKTDGVQIRLYNLDFEDRVGAMRVIGNMFPYDGDLAGSGGGESYPVLDIPDNHTTNLTATRSNSYCVLHIPMFVAATSLLAFALFLLISQRWIPCSG
jgi:hypothetical protein